MIGDLHYIQCSQCDAPLLGDGGLADGTAVFDNHSEAIRAAEKAGWLVQSESIGGDFCAECLKGPACTVPAITHDDWERRRTRELHRVEPGGTNGDQ